MKDHVAAPIAEENFLDVISLATNQYSQYWLTMVKSANDHLSKKSKIIFHVFTDQPTFCYEKTRDLKHIQIAVHEIPSYKWPEATLLRYKVIYENQNLLKSRFLMHLDSDMIFVESPLEILDSLPWTGGISLVQHPGFYRPKGLERIKLYFSNPKLGILDFLKILKHGGLGEWETRSNSTAFVPRPLRKSYVCGATWIGERTPFLHMVAKLNQMVDSDLSNSFIAKWNDESYLNKWASVNEHTELSPTFCFASLRQLKKIVARIVAVEKSNTT